MAAEKTPQYDIVTDQPQLDAACKRLAEEACFAFDTEFVAEETYERHVCLIQVATQSYCALIDPLDGLDVSPFWNLVVSDACQKIVHSGAEDIAICWAQCNKPPANVFDTQIAAGFVGLDFPLSLARLVRRAAHATLHKSQTLTDWRKRPLTQAQLDYAVEDVIHLPRVHQYLVAKLAERGREQWLAEECDKLCAAPANNDAIGTTLREVKSGLLNNWSAILYWAEDDTFYKGPDFQNLEIEDRVGGGDGFASGFCYSFLTGSDPQEAVNIGTAHGAMLQSTRGDTSEITLKELMHVAGGGSARINR